MKLISTVSCELQIIELLSNYGELSGRALRLKMNATRCIFRRVSLASFYATMSKLEDSGSVVYRTKTRCVCGVAIHERLYRLADAEVSR